MPCRLLQYGPLLRRRARAVRVVRRVAGAGRVRHITRVGVNAIAAGGGGGGPSRVCSQWRPRAAWANTVMNRLQRASKVTD